MSSFFWGVIGFIITIGVLVTIHEAGHFTVARFFGVKIIRFSVGFGKPIFSWTGKKEGTKYTVSPFPLGGFVQMYGESEEDREDIKDDMRAFSNKPAWQRFLITFAGPAVNLLFAILIFSVLFISGVNGFKPEVVFIPENSIAANSGLEVGDNILSINHRGIKLSQDGMVALLDSIGSDVDVRYQRGSRTLETHLNLKNLKSGDELDISSSTGLYLAGSWWPKKAIIAGIMLGEAADKMGLMRGDEIIALNHEPLNELIAAQTIFNFVKGSADQKIYLTVLRNHKEIQLSGFLGRRIVDEKQLGYLGVRWQQIPHSYFKQFAATERYGFFESFGKGAQQTWNYTTLTFHMISKMLVGKASLDNLGGPITIADMAGKTMQVSVAMYLNFLGVISLSLAIINLLPIPMLDGGHMFFSLVEMVIRRPINKTLINYSYRIGAAIVFSFMTFVVFKDLWHYLPR